MPSVVRHLDHILDSHDHLDTGPVQVGTDLAGMRVDQVGSRFGTDIRMVI